MPPKKYVRKVKRVYRKRKPTLTQKVNKLTRMVKSGVSLKYYQPTLSAQLPTGWNSSTGFLNLTAIQAPSATSDIGTISTGSGRLGNKIKVHYLEFRIRCRHIDGIGYNTAPCLRMLVVRFKKQNEQVETDLRNLFQNASLMNSNFDVNEMKTGQNAWQIMKDRTWELWRGSPGNLGTSTDYVYSYRTVRIPVNKMVYYDDYTNQETAGALYVQFCTDTGVYLDLQGRVAYSTV